MSSDQSPKRVEKTQSIVAKTIPLLEAVAASEEGIGVREVARRTGIDKSAVSRLFKQLEDLQVVEQSSTSGRFFVGPRLSALGAMLRDRRSMWREAEPILHQLVERFDETCYLVLREFHQARFKERIDSKKTIRYVIEENEVSPLHAGAAGRAILAGMSDEEIERYLETPELAPVTEGTVTSKDVLRKLVDRDKDRGYAVSVGERVVGGAGVAAPLFRADGSCVGSVLFTCPGERFDEHRVPEIAAAVCEAARQLSSRLGYIPDER